MKQRKLKRCFLVLSSALLFLAPIQLSDACGWDGEGYEPYNVIFDKGFFSPRDSKKFELFSDVLFNFEESAKDDHEKNVEEWQRFLNGTDKQLVYNLVYETSEQGLTALNKSLTENNNPGELTEALSKVEWQNVLAYLTFVRKCQPYVNAFDDWSGCFEKSDVFTTLYKQGEDIAAKATTDFLRVRIGYQLCRLAHYMGDFTRSKDYYEKIVQPLKPESIIYFWAKAHYAAALKANGNIAEAQLNYAQVYRHCSTKRYSSFKSIDYSTIDSALSKAVDPNDKVSLYVLNSLETPSESLSNMEKIYQLDPKSAELEVLVYKQIYSYEMNSSYESESGDREVPQLLEFTEKVIEQGQMYRPYIWHLSAGYLSFLNKDYQSAHAHYDLVKATAGTNVTYLKQYVTLLEVVLKAAETEKINTTFEESLLRYLTAMKAVPEGSRLYEASSRISQYVYHLLYATYRKQGELVKAEFVSAQFGDLYGVAPDLIYDHPDSALVSKMIKFVDDPDLNEFEKYLIAKSPYKKTDLMELQGTMLFRLDHLEEAVSYFNQSGDLAKIYADPFETTLKDCIECSDSSKAYTKKELALEMLKYEKLIGSQPSRAAEYYFLLGNAWYNTTSYGTSWEHLAYDRPYGWLGETTDHFEEFWKNNSLDTAGLVAAYQKEEDAKKADFTQEQAYYYDCTWALNSYKMAFGLSKDPEFKAKCLFMAAKCEENARHVKEAIAGLPIGTHTYYTKLYNEYSKTKFYSEIIAECSYIAYYKTMRDTK